MSFKTKLFSCLSQLGLGVVLGLLLVSPSLATEEMRELWVGTGPEGQSEIRLHFFWSKSCPHCREAKPFVKQLSKTYDWLEVKSYEISENKDNANLFTRLTKQLGIERIGVPAFLFCGKSILGYLDEQSTGRLLQNQILDCRNKYFDEPLTSKPSETAEKGTSISVPFFGEMDLSKRSLPFITIVIAGMDAFNPCAFFVLLLLLSLLVTAKDRKRMLFIGGVFVFFSGFVYFIFMAAWLNLFLYLGELRGITIVASLIAIGISLINIKDFFFFKKGVSLLIPDNLKHSLYGKVGKVLNSASFPTMFLGVVTLAIAANSYELLCTAGFPMVYTRILTMREMTSEVYYLYLILYNVIYVIPLLIIVVLFARSLGARKLTEREGRVLKLVSGIMMLELGLLLLISPESLSHFIVAISLFVGALFISGMIVYLDKKFKITG